jgi:hypothetical protein
MTLAESARTSEATGADAPVVPDQAAPDLTPQGVRRLTPEQRGPATVWAAIAVVWIVVAAQALVRWVLSDDFAPAPVIGPDVMEAWRLVALRIFEGVSLLVLLVFLWFCVLRPIIRERRLSLDGKFVLGGLVAFVGDAFLNSREYLFAWNANNINMGVWTRFLPFHDPESSSRYAESIIWGAPMYVYFCAGVAIMSAPMVTWLRRRNPAITTVKLFAAIWVFDFLFDFVAENLIIRLTNGYAYAQTFAPLTLWSGDVHQFPVYESILVATLGSVYTWMRIMSRENPEGLCPAEQGFQRWRPSLQGPVRTLAVIGLCCAATLTVYHLPFNWLGLAGTSVAHLPSYMLPG